MTAKANGGECDWPGEKAKYIKVDVDRVITMMRRQLMTAVLLLVGLMLSIGAAEAGGPVLPRQSVKGTVIVVSNLEQQNFSSGLEKLRAQYLVWVDLQTPKHEVSMPEAGLAMVLFLFQAPQEGDIHPSWKGDLPITPAETPAGQITIFAKTVHPKERTRPRWYACVYIEAPNSYLVGQAFSDALTFGDFPMGKPIVRDTLDFSNIKSIGCMPAPARGTHNPLL